MSTAPGWYDDPDSPGIVRWWDGAAWSQHRAPRPLPLPGAVGYRKVYKTSHGFHLIMTILTGGMWGVFVWLPVGLYNASRA